MLHIPVPEHETLPEKFLVFFWNACNTKHFFGDGHAVGIDFIRHNGFSDRYIKRLLKPYMRFERNYIYIRDQKGGGVCKRSHLTKEGIKLFKKIESYRRKFAVNSYTEVVNTRSGLKRLVLLKEKAVLEHKVYPDMEVIQDMLNEDEDSKQWAEAILNVLNDDNSWCVHYHRKHGDRYYAMGISPQNMPKKYRNRILHKYHQYDIKACHHAIISTLMGSENVPYITQYANNRSQLREIISKESNLSLSQVKTSCSAILYGNNPYNQYPQFNNSITFNNLYQEIQQTMKATSSAWSSNTGGSPGKKLHHFLCGVESEIMRAVMKHHRVDMLLHDGFLTMDEIDTDELSRIVADELGIAIEWDAE